MADVTVGKGGFRGRGVYANRDFEKDEIVIPYDLTELTEEGFRKLPISQHTYVHSFWGKAFLFRGPGRYVNHATNPSTYQDLTKMADVAARPITKGEAITTDGDAEMSNELNTLLEAYEKAANSRDFNNVASFIADDAVFWFTNGEFNGKPSIQKAFEDTWSHIQDETYTISDVQWVAATYWASACTYTFRSAGMVGGKQQVYEEHGTNVLRRIDGSWRIVHEHLSKKTWPEG